MARRPLEKRTVRTLGKRDDSYTVTLPIEYIRELGWQRRQKVTVEKKGSTLIIRDWE